MKFSSTGVIVALIILLVFSGCKSGPEQKLEAPKHAINTYLEGIRDRDKKKILDTVDSRVYLRFDESDPELEKFFSTFVQTNGALKRWTIDDKDVFFSEVNGQAIMNVNVVTVNRNLNMKFDVRTDDGEKWYVFEIKAKQ